MFLHLFSPRRTWMQIIHLSSFHGFWMAPILLLWNVHSSFLNQIVWDGAEVCILQIRGLHENVLESATHSTPLTTDLGP